MGETISQTTPRARKPHVCAYCNATIPKGEKHRAWTWAEDGRLSSLHAHEQCDTMGERVYFPGDDIGDWWEFREECEYVFPDGDFPWKREPCAPDATPA